MIWKEATVAQLTVARAQCSDGRMMVNPQAFALTAFHECGNVECNGNGKEKSPFGSLAISVRETHGFASQPHDWFAFIEELSLSSASYRCPMKEIGRKAVAVKSV